MAKRRGPQPNSNSARRAAGAMVDVPSRRVAIAQQCWTSGQHSDALSLFDEAIRQEPTNVRAYVMAARAYAEKFNFERMEQTLDKLTRRAPRHPGVHHYVGEIFSSLKLPDRAIASFQTAARLPGAGPPTWLDLASLFERAHRLEEAEAFIERTVREGYDLPQVYLVRGRIQRRRKKTDESEATFRALIARSPQDSDWACQAWSELALMKDQEGDFDGAIEAIGHCKRAQKSHEERYIKSSDATNQQIRELIAGVTREEFRRWRENADQVAPLRTALLTGFPRSGTTLLEQVLDSHSNLVSSEERDFIGREMFHSVATIRGKVPLLDVLNDLRAEEIESLRQRYVQAMEYLLSEPIGGRMHLDKNPAYNLTIPLVLRVFPETRLIIALRDPRDVVLSCYLRYLPLNSISVQFLDVQRTAERYAHDMAAWLKFRELLDSPWCEVRYEDTVSNLESQARRALSTLGLAWEDQVLAYRERLLATKQVTSPTYEAVAEPIYTRAIGRWKNYERLLEPAMQILEPFIREFGYN